MRRFFILLMLVFVSAITGFAQPEHPGHGKERIHAAKIAYLVDRMHLTAEQSANFVPLYNDFEKERRECRRKYFHKYKGVDPAEADEATSRQYIDDNLDYQAEIIDIKKKYTEKFLKVVSAQQLGELHEAEREFAHILVERLKRERGPHGGHGDRRPPRD